MAAKRISVDGIEMAYEEHGAGERALVLVHGFTGSRRDFAPRVPALAALSRIVLPDLRGHGDSTNTGDEAGYTLARLADDLLGFLDAAGIARCDLLGHSMGGMVALRAVLEAPARFDSLVLMDTAARAPDGYPRDVLALAARIAREAGMETLLRLMRARAAEDPDRLEADRRLEAELGEAYWSEWRRPNVTAMDPVAYGALGTAIFEQAPLTARLGEIRCPTLVLVGAGDRGFLAASRELARAIAGARLVEIPEAAHQPQLEAPAAWLEAICAHLVQVRDPASFPAS